jgi:protein-S-isoprenylcysteine O-methyltransferase Ste14
VSWWRDNRGGGYVVIQAALLALVAAGPWIDPASWSGEAAPWLVTACVLGAAGVGLASAGVVALGRNLTPLPHPREGATFVENGAYAAVRHPIYAGLALAAFAWALAFRSPVTLVLAIVLFTFLDIKSRREERWLVEAFPAYAEYRRRVKRLIPFVY